LGWPSGQQVGVIAAHGLGDATGWVAHAAEAANVNAAITTAGPSQIDSRRKGGQPRKTRIARKMHWRNDF